VRVGYIRVPLVLTQLILGLFCLFTSHSATLSLDGPWLFKTVDPLDTTQTETERKVLFSSRDFDDGDWTSTQVPSYWDQPNGGWPWSNPTRPGGPAPDHDGEAWYRLEFRVPTTLFPRGASGEELTDSVAIFRFEGVSAWASVWLNGAHIEENLGAFAPFEMEVPAGWVRPGTNVLAVRVRDKTLWGKDIPLGFDPRSGGIYRPVQLILAPDKRILDIFVRPELDSLTVDGSVSRQAAGSTKLKFSILEGLKGNTVYGPILYPDSPSPLNETNFTLPISDLGDVKTWSPEYPDLYRLRAELTGEGGETLDQQEVVFGFRTFQIDHGRFLLNEQPYFLFGAGSPPHYENVPESVASAHLKGLRNAGVRIVRFAHEPPSEMWLDLCDDIGLLAWVEGPISADDGPYDFADTEFANHANAEMVALVRAARNHPSLVIWSIGSGNYAAIPRDSHSAREAAAQVLEGMAERLSHELVDPTRIIIPESNNRGSLDSPIEDWHSGYGWYYGRTDDWRDSLPSWTLYSDEIPGATAPWVSSEIATGYSSSGQGNLIREPQEEAATRMRIGTPGADTAELSKYQSVRIKQMIEDARSFRDPTANRMAGLFPFTSANWFFNPLTPDQMSPKPILDAIEQAYSPVLLAVESRKQNYYAGEVYSPTLTVANDDIGAGTLGTTLLVCEVRVPGSEAPSRSQGEISNVPYYTSSSKSLAVVLPDVETIEKAIVKVLLKSGEDTLASNTTTINIGNPQYCKPTPTDVTGNILLHDPNNRLRPVLSKLGIEILALENLTQLPASSGLLIAPGAFDGYVVRSWETLKTWVENGGRLLVFDQEKKHGRWEYQGPYPGNLVLSEPEGWPTGIDRANLRVPDHPLFDGLTRDHLSAWGAGDVLARTVLSASTGVDAGRASTHARTLVDVVPSVDNLEWKNLVLEVEYSEGRILFCQLLVVEHIVDDPIAARFLKNTLAWVGAARTPILVNIPTTNESFLAPLIEETRTEAEAPGSGVGPEDSILAIQLDEWTQGRFKMSSRQGVESESQVVLETISEDRRIYYDLDDRFWFDEGGPVEIDVWVFCDAPSTIRLDYDSDDDSLGMNKTAKKTPPRKVVETGIWKPQIFSLPDARFGNGQYGGCDFSLEIEEGNAVFGPITVRRGRVGD